MDDCWRTGGERPRFTRQDHFFRNISQKTRVSPRGHALRKGTAYRTAGTLPHDKWRMVAETKPVLNKINQYQEARMYIRWANPISMGISESYMRIIKKALADVSEELGPLAEFVRCIEVVFVKVNGAIVPDFTVHIGTEVHPMSFATQVPFAGSVPTYEDLVRHFGTNGLLRGRILQHLNPPDYDSVVNGIRTAFEARIK